jgi:hypothetical protein
MQQARPQGEMAHEMAPEEILQSCTADCEQAREAIRQAAEITHGTPDCSWVIEASLMPSPPGEIRLSLGGGLPHGRVSAGFRYRWFLALADAALEAARLIREQEHG